MRPKKYRKYLHVKGFQKHPQAESETGRKMKKQTETSIGTQRSLFKYSNSFCWNKLDIKPRTVEIRLRKRESKDKTPFKGWDTIDD